MELPSHVVLASDHAGFVLKERVKDYLAAKGIEVLDAGTHSAESVDYPPIIREGCRLAQEKGCPAIVLGGSGNGEAMAANKMRGIRAALCYSLETARLARAHNDANVLSLGARLTEPELALQIVDLFLTTDFEGGRHERRINDLDAEFAA